MSLAATNIKLKQTSKLLAVSFNNGQSIELSFEFLRVHSPSAEVRGHGAGQEVLQWGKQHVGITAIEPIGHYALKISFDDGHDTGLYSWPYLLELGQNADALWQQYLDKLAQAGKPRDPDVQFLTL